MLLVFGSFIMFELKNKRLVNVKSPFTRVHYQRPISGKVVGSVKSILFPSRSNCTPNILFICLTLILFVILKV